MRAEEPVKPTTVAGATTIAKPYVTYTLIVINLLVFAVLYALSALSGAPVQRDFRTERSIFEFLRMKYVAPAQRNKVINLASFDMETASEIELSQRIKQANHAYHELGESLMTDAEFESTMECTRAAFAQLPKWKRDNKKRQAKLF